jgi:hypothetical protein
MKMAKMAINSWRSIGERNNRENVAAWLVMKMAGENGYHHRLAPAKRMAKRRAWAA